jgi:hypothetical protein
MTDTLLKAEESEITQQGQEQKQPGPAMFGGTETSPYTFPDKAVSPLKTVFFDEASNFACTAAEEVRGKLVTGEPEQEKLTMEEDVVDDYLTLENNGERLVFDLGNQQLVLADSEFHSKRDVREFADDVRNVLESLAYTVSNKVRYQRSEEYTKLVQELKVEKLVSNWYKLLSEKLQRNVTGLETALADAHKTGWVVVDTTWKRGPLHLTSSGWLATADSLAPYTVFNSEEEALKAVASTRSYSGGTYAWSKNEYVAVELS